MNMLYVLLGIWGVSLLLFLASFLQKDPLNAVEKSVEELSINMYQEQLKLKKRIKVLEEELMMGSPVPRPKKAINEIIRNQVISLYKQGVPPEKIGSLSDLSKEDVRSIIQGIS